MNLFYLFLIIPTVCIAAIIDFNPTDLLGKLPKCSLECVLKGATSQGCEITDLSCQCSHLEALSRTVAPCLVHAGCSLEDLITASQPVVEICEKQGKLPTASANPAAPAPGAAVNVKAGIWVWAVPFAMALAML